MGEKVVEIYTTSTCPFCLMTKKYLESKGVKYIEYNVELDQQKAYEMIAKSKQMGVPVLDIGGTIIVGFNRPAIDVALAKLEDNEEKNTEIEEIRKKKIEKIINQNKREENVFEVNELNFNEKVIEKSKSIPILVDFWAPWCGPCRILGPILEKIAAEYNGKLMLAKINVDENEILANEYNISSIPTVKLFKNGIIVDEFVGALPEHMVRIWIDKTLK
ncbi:MAG: thioredoxin [Candidatus Micrarchaeia archaeon]